MTENHFQALRRELGRTLKRRVRDTAMRYVEEREGAVTAVLRDPSLASALRAIASLKGERLGWSERSRLTAARTRLVESQKYKELEDSLRELFDASDGDRAGVRRPSPVPYVAKMTVAIVEPLDGETYENLTAEPPAILGAFRDGMLSIEAEAWVPFTAVLAYYREMQRYLGKPPREIVRVKSLDLFLWVRARRANVAKEKWRDTMRAWNRSHDRKYGDVSNFHRDYHQAKRRIEAMRAQASKLRDRAHRIEFEEGSEPRHQS